jgi:hypothetical protein
MRTILLDLPLKCKGYIYEDMATGEKCCILNSRYSHEANQKTYKHETEHAKNKDLEKDINVSVTEAKRHFVKFEEEP